jgi:hypothetical protein
VSHEPLKVQVNAKSTRLMKITKLNKLTTRALAFAVSGSFVAVCGLADAQDITYEFEASPPSYLNPSDLNGSTITIGEGGGGPEVVSWNIDLDGSHITAGTLTLDGILSFDSSGFVGNFDIQDGGLIGGLFITGSDGPGTFFNPDGGTLNASIDPIGAWTDISNSDPPGVPDGASTLLLLTGVAAAMGGVRQYLRLRGAATPALK